MIDEDALWYKRGDLVEFELHLGGGTKVCRGVVLNTAVLFGRGARQVWILDMDEATPEQEAHWTSRKHIIHEEDIHSQISAAVIGADTLLRDHPVSFPIHNGKETVEKAAITMTVAIPTTSSSS